MDIKIKQMERENNKMKKTLTLYPFNQKFPTVYESTIELFSKNYNLNYSPLKISYFYWLKDNHLIRNFYYLIMKIFRKYLKLNNLKKKPKMDVEKNLLFCFNQLPPPEFDFILDLETVIGLANYDYSKLDREYISARLASKKCKAITCWNNFAYNDLIKIIDCSKFKNKINIIPFAGNSPRLRKTSKDGLNFLFVASINNPLAFMTKGGLIALEAYANLTKKYKNIKFFVRANINDELVKQYKDIPGLIFLRKYLTNDKMEELSLNSDILLEPLPGMDLMMKSMEFGLPLISFDYECAFETIINKKTGFLINSFEIFGDRDNLDKYYKNQNENYKLLSKKEECLKFVPKFVEKCETLIKNRKLLNKMVKQQHSLVEEGGKYSLYKRNEKLLKLINPHIK